MSATLSISDTWVFEGDSGTTLARFTVRLSEASVQAVSVDFATADGTAKGKGDYQRTNGTLTFAPGETEKTITVAVNGDKSREDDEHFFVDLSAPIGAVIDDGRGDCTIINDDTDNGRHGCPPHDRSC